MSDDHSLSAKQVLDASLDLLATKDAEIKRLTSENEQALREATNLLVSFVNQHFDPVPEWAPLPDLVGVITQIDNSTTVVRDIKAENKRLSEALEAMRAACSDVYPWGTLVPALALADAALSPIPDPAGGMPVEKGR